MGLFGMIEGDGNGKLTIPKWFLAVVVILVSIIATCASVFTTQATMNEKTKMNEQQIDDLQNKVDDQKQLINKLRRNTAVTNSRLETIQKDIEHIKNKLEEMD